MIICGLKVFPFTSKKVKGNCTVCGRRMVSGKGYYHTYYKLIRRRVMDKWFHPDLPNRQTKMRFLCSEDCVTIHRFRTL